MKNRCNLTRTFFFWAILLALPAVGRAVIINDNFTNAANWGAPLIVQGTANMSVGSGRMNYTSTSTNHSGTGLPRKTPLLPITQDWSLKVDVHVAPFTLITNEHYIDVFLGIAKTDDPFNNLLLFEFDRGWWSGGPGYDIGDDMTINGVDAPELFTLQNLSSPDASLRMDYAAANQALTFYFDSDGAANGYDWVAMGIADLGSGTYDMNLVETDTFTIVLAGSSMLQTVAAGEAYLSNLEIFQPSTNVAGHVYCECDGSPVAGALVQFGTNYFAITDTNGNYSISNVLLGIYTATVMATNFASQTNEVEISSDFESATNDFFLPSLKFVINPVFDESITSDANALTITNAINSAIEVYKQSLANPICVSILFATTTDAGVLGQNSAALEDIPYSQYLADLQANPSKSANDGSALASLPAGPGTGLNGNTVVTLTAANLAAIGETALADAAVAGNGGGFHGTILLNVSSLDSLQSTVTHEIAETLGTGGWGSALHLQTTYTGQASPTTGVGSLDLFRFGGPGARSFTLNPNATAYFSVNGGTTPLVYFNQYGHGSDFGDWGDGVSPADGLGNTPPQVQDAFGTGNPSLGRNEYIALDVVGYTLMSPPPTIQTAAFAAHSFSFGWTALPGQSYQLQVTTNLASNVWTDLGAPIIATNLTAAIVDNSASTPERFYRVVTLQPPPVPALVSYALRAKATVTGHTLDTNAPVRRHFPPRSP